ncbi:hypothetical protein VIGAN_06057600, partial [Vigna angularis var. angularis]
PFLLFLLLLICPFLNCSYLQDAPSQRAGQLRRLCCQLKRRHFDASEFQLNALFWCVAVTAFGVCSSKGSFSKTQHLPLGFAREACDWRA